MKNNFIMVLGMALVTYIPRMIPLAILPGVKLPSYLKSFLSFIPIAVLSALIFPAFISSTGRPLTAILGAITAFILAYKEKNLIFVVLGAIFAVFVSSLIF
ncbi:MAG TPA: AzlD domain-containing protein [Halanaerobiales bacterium]|nr:AzlD domain-containing protein [Halanaerobiales bacterium]